MTTTETDPLVRDYMRRLETAASRLPRERRKELIDEIREHLDAALADAAPDDEIAVRNALERLGSPEEIVQAAADPAPPPVRSGWLEIAAVVLLILPGVGWFAGMAPVALSRVWSAREKVVGIALAVVPALFFFLAWSLGSPGDDSQVLQVGVEPVDARVETDSSTALGFVFTALTILSGLPSALYLGWRLHRHDRRVEALSGTR
jgi:hypothetical protein